MVPPLVAGGDGCENKIRVYETTRSEKGASLSIENLCHVPLTIEVNFHSLLNLEPDVPRPIMVFLGTRESQPLVNLNANEKAIAWRKRVISPRQLYAWRYGTVIRYVPGRSPAVHDDSVRYAFPFGGSEPRLCVQGAHGTLTHWNRHAFDFVMPIGTPVLAARAGIVFSTIDGFEDDGRLEERYMDRSNRVLILHSDDTIGAYGHLTRGLLVTEGDVVSVGQLLGYSGNSGFSGGPHLHFDVNVPELDVSPTVPIQFVGDQIPTPGNGYPSAVAR